MFEGGIGGCTESRVGVQEAAQKVDGFSGDESVGDRDFCSVDFCIEFFESGGGGEGSVAEEDAEAGDPETPDVWEQRHGKGMGRGREGSATTGRQS